MGLLVRACGRPLRRLNSLSKLLDASGLAADLSYISLRRNIFTACPRSFPTKTGHTFPSSTRPAALFLNLPSFFILFSVATTAITVEGTRNMKPATFCLWIEITHSYVSLYDR